MDYDKVAERYPLIPREELEALGRVWEDPVTKAALRKFLNSFRVQAVNACVNVIPDFYSADPKQPAGAVKVAFNQGKVNVLDAIWGMLEDIYNEKEEGTPPQKEANDAEQKKET